MRIESCTVLIVAALAIAAWDHAQELAAPQAPPQSSGPIAIVPLDTLHPDLAARVTGALDVSAGRAMIGASGTVTSGAATTNVVLPRRGVLRVCAATSVKLAADSSVPTGEAPGLMMAIDHGAVEMSFATSRNADILLTPDFRILIAGPGAAEVKVRLGQHGDTCVDNGADRASSSAQNIGADAPYVLVTSVFDGGDYRVQPGQRVMFQHGSLQEVVDQEKEPCGCPPAAPSGNEFPLAQSEGLAPLAAAKPAPASPQTLPTEPLTYKSGDHPPKPETETKPVATAPAEAQAPAATAPPKKPGFFSKIGSFFRRIFGAE